MRAQNKFYNTQSAGPGVANMLNIYSVQAACVVVTVVIAVFFDVRERRIPNRLCAAALIASLAVQVERHAALDWLGGALAGFALFIPGYLVRQMGAGDVKLMAAVGAFFGALGAIKVGLVAYAVGGACALVWIILQRDNKAWWAYLKFRLFWVRMNVTQGWGGELSDAKPRTAPMPYSIPIAIAAVGAVAARW